MQTMPSEGKPLVLYMGLMIMVGVPSCLETKENSVYG